MNKLPYDVSRCFGATSKGNCPMKEDCVRFLDKAIGGHRVPYMIDVQLNDDGTCPHQIPVQEK